MVVVSRAAAKIPENVETRMVLVNGLDQYYGQLSTAATDCIVDRNREITEDLLERIAFNYEGGRVSEKT